MNGHVTPESMAAPMDLSSSSPGAILKRCREYHEISLQEAAEATKVGEAYLDALENDRISEFANLAYLKGFLRIYSSYLGLNPEDLSRLYDKQYGSPSTGEAPAAGRLQTSAPPRRRITLRRLGLPALLLLLLIITSLVINRRGPAPVVPPAPVAQPQGNQTASAVQPALSSARVAPAPAAGNSSRTPAPTRQQEAAQEPAPAPVVLKGVLVRMKVTENGTMSATIDGSSAQRYELNVGDLFEWKAERSIVLELSSGGGVEVELNGKPLKQLGSSKHPTVVTIDADGVHQ